MDNCFFRFLDNFDRAKDLQNCKLSSLNYNDQIHLKPGEDYSLITNNSGGIAFDGNYSMYIVDCDNNILANITPNTFIEEFENSDNGTQQIKLELINIQHDFYADLVHFRIDHTILNGNSYWSNPFLISDYNIEETIRFRFKHSYSLDGTDYSVANIFQSIRLKCYKEKNSFESTKDSYTTFDALKYSSRLIKPKSYNILFDRMNDFIYDRMQYLLSHDVIYIYIDDIGVRVTDKQTFENADKLSNTTNVALNRFKVAVDENDIDNYGYQIFEDLTVIDKFVPHHSSHSLDDFNAAATAGLWLLFNSPITVEPAFEYELYEDGILVGHFTGYNLVGNKLYLTDFPGYTFGIKHYAITIQPNMISGLNGGWEGLNTTQWNFDIVLGYYNPDYYDEAYYLT